MTLHVQWLTGMVSITACEVVSMITFYTFAPAIVHHNCVLHWAIEVPSIHFMDK